ncbi:HIT family protein [Paenibacillus xylanexedens]|uniref:HIT family protein n=1 Tax=Paenibacillus xylanexedens TaxID=528191 RepID=UPI0011A175D0|nr:HIT family protein [Paenibacillus xylanexedens]
MTNDFYCEEVLNGKTKVKTVMETENVLAYYHTRPFYEVHIVVIPKKHIDSLISLMKEQDHMLLIEMMEVVSQVSARLISEYGASKIVTNIGKYQDSKHLHWHVVYGETIRD